MTKYEGQLAHDARIARWTDTLKTDGYCVVPDAISRETVAALAQDLAGSFEQTPCASGPFYGSWTKRFHGLLARSSLMDDFVRHPLVLPIVEEILSGACDTIQLNLTQAIEILPGGQIQPPHRDQDGLAHGRYFFMDIARDGIVLYASDETELLTPKPKTSREALELAQEYYDYWFSLAVSSQKTFRFCLSQNEVRDAAFNLHQACERLYHCVLLVMTFYTPHVHNLNFLRTQAERVSGRLVAAWPRTSRQDRSRFEKLKDAYVKARFSKHYRITEGELTWLADRIEELGKVVEEVCQARLGELRSKV